MGIIFGKLSKSVEEDVASKNVISVAGKRKATEDNKNPREKHRRLDISCGNGLPAISADTDNGNTPEAAPSQRSGKRKAVADDGPVVTKTRTLELSARFRAKYHQQEKLGQGGYGSVFAGYRKTDNLIVVIKHVPRNEDLLKYKDHDGKQIPMEVAVMLKLAAETQRHSAPIDLLDWYDLGQELILVLERPMTAVDLRQYMQDKRGCIEAEEVKIIMRQLVAAAIELEQRHIFHRDIKMENLLIESCMKAPRVRVIDFGAACFVEEEEDYEYFMGSYPPPEWYRRGKYKAGPTTVFQIGAVLVNILRQLPDNSSHSINWSFSENSRDFVKACLWKDPKRRLTLEELRNHLWLR